jgi:hypothetical protein
MWQGAHMALDVMYQAGVEHLQEFCDRHAAPLEARPEGRRITLVRNDDGSPVAQLRIDLAGWLMFLPDGGGGWHGTDTQHPASDVRDLLTQLDLGPGTALPG